MKRKHLALLLAAALTVTSVDGTAFMVNAADFTAESAESQEAEAQSDETSETVVAEEESEADFDAENAEIEDGGVNSEVTEEADGDEITAENEDEISDEAAIADEDEVQVEGEEDFTSDAAGDEVKTVQSVTLDTSKVKKFAAGVQSVYLDDLVVNVTYTDNTTDKVKFPKYSASVADGCGNQFFYALRKKNSEEEINSGSCLEEGTYECVLYCNGQKLKNTADVSVVAPEQTSDYKGTLNVGENKDLVAPLDGEVIYRFAPGAGTYFAGNAWGTYYAWKKSEGKYTSLSTNWKLKDGDVIYVIFSGEAWGNDKFNMRISEVSSVVSVDTLADSYTLTTIWDGTSPYSSVPGDVVINYKDDSSTRVTVSLENTYEFNGHDAESKVFNKDGTEFNWTENDNQLPVGEYIFVFTIDGQEYIRKPLTVKDGSYDRLPKLEKSVQHLTVDTNVQRFSYTPDENATYHLQFKDNRGWAINLSYGEVIDGNSMTSVTNTSLYAGNDLTMDLKAGTKYVFSFWLDPYSTEIMDIDLDFYTIPEAEDITITNYAPKPMTFAKGLEAIQPEYIETTVNFDEGEPETFRYDGESGKSETDKYGKGINWILYKVNTDGTETPADLDNIETGKYDLRICYGTQDYNGNISEEDAVISTGGIWVDIVKPSEIKGTVDLTGNNGGTVENTGSKVIYSYTPSVASRYKFEFDSEIYNAKLTDSEGNVLCTANSNYIMYGALEAGKTYYLSGYFDKENENVAASVERSITPVKLKTELLKPNQTYLEDIDTYGDVALQTTLTYVDENGKDQNRVIKPDEEIGGLSIGYMVECVDGASDDEPYEISKDTCLTAGTWRITPVLSEKRSDDEEYALNENASTDSKVSKVSAESVEITVKSLASLKNLTELTFDKWTDVASSGRFFYEFKAPENGRYEVVTEGGATAGVYMADDSDTYGDAELVKGQSYVVIVWAKNNAKVKIQKYVEHEKQEKKEYNLKEGFEENLPLDDYESFSFKFTPKVSGNYKLYVNMADYGDGESGYTLKLMCNGEKQEEFSESSVVAMEAGKTYEYVLSSVYGYLASTVSFKKIHQKKITKMELVSASGAEYSVGDYILGIYDLKITYENGTVKTYSDYDYNLVDEFENRISVSQDIKENSTGTETTVKFSYRLPGSYDDISVSSVTIKSKDISSYAEIKTGDTKQPLKDASGKDDIYYRFTAPKTGKYIVQLDAGKNFHYEGIYMWTYDKGDDSGYSWNTEQDLLDTYGGYGMYNLKEGQTYLIRLTDLNNYSKLPLTLTVKNAKKLKSVEVVAKPTKNYVYRGFEDQSELEGMKVKAVYDDGSDETVEYGTFDSMGNQIETYSASVLNASKARVYVKFGQYRTYVDLELKDTNPDTMQKAEIGQETKVDMKGDNVAFVKFVPTEDGYYGLHVNNTVGVEWIYRVRDQKEIDTSEAYLEAGETYYIRLVSYATPVVKLMKGACNWVETEKTATCTEDGENSRTCTTHGITEKEITKATGHKFGEWKVTKQPTCGVAGTEERTCSVCKTVEKRAIAATGKHKYGSWKTTKEATVLTAGQQERSCSVCGKKETSATAKLKATIEMNVSGTVPLKRKQTFNVKVTTGKGDKVVSWKSSNKKVVSVSKNGKIKGIKAGKTATITVQLQSGLKASFKVKVQKKAVATKSIKVTNASTGKNVGKKLTMKAKGTLKLAAAVSPVTSKQKVTYSSSNKKIATVTSKGVIKAKKKGKVTITVKSGKKSYKIKITVK